jgi:hypothetical protein
MLGFVPQPKLPFWELGKRARRAIAANPVGQRVARNRGVHLRGLRFGLGREIGSAIVLLGKVHRSVEQGNEGLAVLNLLVDPAQVFLRGAL